jgi:hypothetical protein
VVFSFCDTAYAATLTVVLLALLAGFALAQLQLVEKRGALPLIEEYIALSISRGGKHG